MKSNSSVPVRRRFLVFTVVACLGLGLSFSHRWGRIESVMERDGQRKINRQGIGPFLFVAHESDASLHVSDDLRAELRRLKLKLPASTIALLGNADRLRSARPILTYSLQGEVAEPPKAIIDEIARQLAHPLSQVKGTMVSAGGLCADGRSRIHAVAAKNGAKTRFGLFLSVR